MKITQTPLSLALATLLALEISALAGTIALNNLPISGTDAASGLDASSTYLCALDFGSASTLPVVNGVSFQKANLNGAGTGVDGLHPVFSGVDPVYGGSWTVSAAFQGNANGFATVGGGGTSMAEQADGEMASLLSDAIYLPGAVTPGSVVTQNFGGLVVGGQYSLRVYYRQWSATARPVTAVFNGEGFNQAYESNPLDLDAAAGANYIAYDFTATRSFVLCTLTTTITGQGPMIYGATLQQTAPPPLPVAPTISAEPVGATNWVGRSVALTVGASGTTPLTYQWYQNDVELSSANTSQFAIGYLETTHAGQYYVVITNTAGSITSSVVSIGVWSGTNVISPSLSIVEIPAGGSDAASGIDPANHYVSALDFGSGLDPLSINGVAFEQISLSGRGLSLDANAPVFMGNDTTFGGSWRMSAAYTGGSGFASHSAWQAQADGDLGLLLNDFAFLGGSAVVGDWITLDFGGLIAGRNYSVRCYYRQWNSGGNPPRPIIFSFDGHGTNESYQTDLDLGGAFYIRHDFKAASSMVSMRMTSAGAGNGAHVYGATLEATTPLTPAAPTIDLQPKSGTNWAGLGYTMHVLASGPQPLAYQWYKGNTPIDGATTATLELTGLTSSDSGNFQAVVSNDIGSVTSQVATVTVSTDKLVFSPSLSVVALPAVGTDAASEIDAGNQYLCALDFGTDTGPLSINGVTFQQINTNGAGGGADVSHPIASGVDATYGGTWELSGDYAGSLGLYSMDSTQTQADGGMGTLLNDFTFLGGTVAIGDTLTLKCGGLTPGASYSFRNYYRGWSGPRNVLVTFDGGGASEACEVDWDAGGAYYLKYDFIAATTQMRMTTETRVWNSGCMLYGMTLQKASGPPMLMLSRSANSLTISWDVAITGYVLESSSALSPASWTAVPAVANNSITVETANGTRFFRLRQQN